MRSPPMRQDGRVTRTFHIPSSQWRRLGVVAAVAALHVGLGLMLSRIPPTAPSTPERPAFEVILYDPPQPPQPPPPPERPVSGGGGAPAAPSRLRAPARPPRIPPEVVAPPRPAPEQPLVVGVAPEPSPQVGQGQGGQGTGSGTGAGAGAGPGEGVAPARLVRGPSLAELRREHPPAAFAARRGGRGEVSCVIRIDTRLEDCRLVSESPQGMGFGEAALRSARYFRFEPPTRGGAPVAGQRVVFGVEFGLRGPG